MPALTYCTAQGFWAATTTDSADVGTDPDLVPIRGGVTFTYKVKVGQVLRAVALTTPTGVALTPVTGVLRDGVLKDRHGGTGVRLLANTSVLNLDGALYCTVAFTNTTFNGHPVTLSGFDFALPSTDTVVNLIEATPVTGLNASGITFGQPTYPFLVTAGPPATVQWKTAGGTNVGPVVEMPALDASTQIDSAVAAAVSAVIAGAPGALDTLNELAAALGDDPNFATTVTTALAARALASRTVNGHALTADVTVTKSDVGLGSADNTSDAGKPVSTAQAAADTAVLTASQLALANANNSGPSLLMDGSYEQDATYWAQEISPVDTHNTLSTTQAYSGTQSMKWVGPTTHYPNVTAPGKAGNDATYGYVKTTTGRVYRLSFWVYRAAGNTSTGFIRGGASLQGAGGSDLVNGTAVNQSAITTDTWTYYSTFITVPRTGTNAPYSGIAPNIGILSTDSADVFYVDKVRFDDLTDAPVELLAPPPTGDRTTDTANVQPLVDLAQTTNGTVVLRAGTYAIDIVTQKLNQNPRIIGQGKGLTFWDGTLKMCGVSSKYSGGWLSDFSFTGSHAGSAALELNGVCDVHWDRVRVVGTYDFGIWFHNELSGDYAELNHGKMDFYFTVTTALKYTVGAGSGSFHWSGLTGGAIQHAGLGPAVLIETSARPYNAPLTVGVWSTSGAYPVIQHNGDTKSNFFGNLTVEQDAVAALAAGSNLYFAGTVSSYMGVGLALSKGTLTQIVAGVQAVSGGSLTPLPINVASGGELDLYNTADQVTNLERGFLRWVANVLTIGVENVGTGILRKLSLVNKGRIDMQATAQGPTVGTISLFDSTSAVSACTAAITGTGSAASGIQYGLSVSPTYNQSSTAGYTALLVNPTETATGSGSKLLADFQVGAVSKFSIDHTGVVTVAAVGTAAGSMVTVDGTQTLTGKTLTTPVLNGTPTGTGVASASTASTLALRDSSANLLADVFIATKTSTATAAGTTTLTIADTQVQEFTGSTTQTVKLPTTGVSAGQSYTIVNNSSGNITVQSSGANGIVTVNTLKVAVLIARIDAPTAAADWYITGWPIATVATASTVAERDGNGILAAVNFVGSVASTATAAGTTTLTIADKQVQVFTGSTTQTVKLPTTSVTAGQSYIVSNQSSGAVTVQSSAANTIQVLAAGDVGIYTVQTSTPTTAAHWVATLTPSGTQTLTSKTLTNPTITNYTESVVAIGTVTTTNTLDLTSGTVQTATLTASTACTFTVPTATAGKSFTLYLKQAAATGNGTATFTSVKWPTAGAPTITATAGKMDILSFVSDGASWYGSYQQGYTP